MMRAPLDATAERRLCHGSAASHCAGLDVHQDTVMACVRCVSSPKAREVRTFGTTARELLALADRLASHGCTHVAMEASGGLERPLALALAEQALPAVVVNACQVRNFAKALGRLAQSDRME
jgi:transposase